MMRVVRTLLLVLGAFVLGWFAGRVQAVDEGPSVTEVERPDSAVQGEAEVSLAGRSVPVVPPPARLPRAPTRTPDEGFGDSASSVSGIAGYFEVTLDLPEGWTNRAGRVYALPAGSPGLDHRAAPSVSADYRKPTRLPVPAAGRWDVGYAGQTGGAMAVDVTIRKGGVVPLTLRPAETQPVVFHLAEALPPGVRATAFARCAVSSDASLPGRGEYPRASAAAHFQGRIATTPPLPVGVPLRVWAQVPLDHAHQLDANVSPGYELVCERGRAEAGETVEVAVLRRARLLLRVQSDPSPPPTWSLANTTYVPHLSFGLEVLGARRQGASANLDAEVLASSQPALGFVSRPGTARLTWTERCGVIHEGMRDGVVLPPGETVVLDVVLRIDPTVDPLAPPPSRLGSELPLPVQAPGAKPLDEEHELQLAGHSCYEGCTHQDVDLVRFDDLEQDLEVDDSWAEATTVVAVQGSDLASHAVSGPFRNAIRVPLRPAGLLMVAPESLWPEAVGTLRVRRADGAPLAHGHWEDGETRLGRWEMEVTAGPGVLLGPLPAGTHRFHVHLGTLRLADAVATVRAGWVDVLRITR